MEIDGEPLVYNKQTEDGSVDASSFRGAAVPTSHADSFVTLEEDYLMSEQVLTAAQSYHPE